MREGEKIRAFIKRNMAITHENVTITDDDNIFEKGFVDSMFAMQLVSYVENEFGISVNNEDLDLSNFSSIQNITRFIEQKKDGQR